MSHDLALALQQPSINQSGVMSKRSRNLPFPMDKFQSQSPPLLVPGPLLESDQNPAACQRPSIVGNDIIRTRMRATSNFGARISVASNHEFLAPSQCTPLPVMEVLSGNLRNIKLL